MTTRIITMTNRPPVQINDEDWEVIAEASGDSFVGNDYGRRQQALGQGECDRYTLKVRQHDDGERVIVSGVFDAASAWTSNESIRGGVLLKNPSTSAIVQAIREVGEYCHLPDRIIRDCIADMPAEELT